LKNSLLVLNNNIELEFTLLNLTVPSKNQPFLCTHLSCLIKTEDPQAVIYVPRS